MPRINWEVVCLLLFTFVSGLAVAQAQGASAKPEAQPSADLNTIVTRMEQAALANRDHYRPYVLTREYRMYNSEAASKPASEVVASISFVPPSTQEYKITETRGSSRGKTVVEHILENEAKAAATGRAPGAISRDNYDFLYLGEAPLDGHTCYLLGLHPKRKEKSLVVGRAWVDTNTYLVRRVEGELAKMPSWWLKSIQVKLDFADQGGMWLQTGLRADADVRIFGPHVLMANAVGFQAADVTAQNKVPPTARSKRAGGHASRFQSSEDLVGAALPVRH